MDDVVAIAAIKEIGKIAAVDIVGAIFAIDVVGARLAIENVVARLAIDRVIAIAGIDAVIVSGSANHFVGVSAMAGGAIWVGASIGANIQEILVATADTFACDGIGPAVLPFIRATRGIHAECAAC